jgi:hypothetical protein
MGKLSESKPSHEGSDMERGYVAESSDKKFPATNMGADRISPEKVEKAQSGIYDSYTSKVAPGSNRSKEEKGSI